jgi:zinc transporter, ZIP family
VWSGDASGGVRTTQGLGAASLDFVNNRRAGNLARLFQKRDPTLQRAGRDDEVVAMQPIVEMLVYTSLSGLAIPAGGLLGMASWFLPTWLDREVRHWVLALGGGILVGTVALALVPEGLKSVPHVPAMGLLAAGGLFFCWIDVLIKKAKSAGSQMMAMLADFVPETLAVGAAFAAGEGHGRNLALLIAAQNLPEAFNAYREIDTSYPGGRRSLILRFTALAALGPIVGLAAHLWLADAHALVGGVMLFVSGGILYLTFQDIAPQVKLENAWGPPLGAVMGFMIALAASLMSTG